MVGRDIRSQKEGTRTGAITLTVNILWQIWKARNRKVFDEKVQIQASQCRKLY